MRADVPVNAYLSMILSLLAIIACGGAGALIGFFAIDAMGLSGVAGALLASLIGVLVATLLWALGVVVLKALRWLE